MAEAQAKRSLSSLVQAQATVEGAGWRGVDRSLSRRGFKALSKVVSAFTCPIIIHCASARARERPYVAPPNDEIWIPSSCYSEERAPTSIMSGLYPAHSIPNGITGDSRDQMKRFPPTDRTGTSGYRDCVARDCQAPQSIRQIECDTIEGIRGLAICGIDGPDGLNGHETETRSMSESSSCTSSFAPDDDNGERVSDRVLPVDPAPARQMAATVATRRAEGEMIRALADGQPVHRGLVINPRTTITSAVFRTEGSVRDHGASRAYFKRTRHSRPCVEGVPACSISESKTHQAMAEPDIPKGSMKRNGAGVTECNISRHTVEPHTSYGHASVHRGCIIGPNQEGHKTLAKQTSPEVSAIVGSAGSLKVATPPTRSCDLHTFSGHPSILQRPAMVLGRDPIVKLNAPVRSAPIKRTGSSEDTTSSTHKTSDLYTATGHTSGRQGPANGEGGVELGDGPTPGSSDKSSRTHHDGPTCTHGYPTHTPLTILDVPSHNPYVLGLLSGARVHVSQEDVMVANGPTSSNGDGDERSNEDEDEDDADACAQNDGQDKQPMGYEGTSTSRSKGEVGIEEGGIHHRAQAENLSRPMRSLSSHPSSPTMESLSGRLRCLLDQLHPIMRQSSTSVNPLAIRMRWLHSFYARLIDLLNQIQASGQDVKWGGECSTLAAFAAKVGCLESEWWESEFVAAWFGPTRALRERVLARPVEENAGQVEIKEDWKYVGLYDEGRRE